MNDSRVRLFGTDGVRGVANHTVTPELVLQLGRALGTLLRAELTSTRVVVVGHDPRPSSEMLDAALTAGLCSVGVNVLSVGVAPTAAVAHLVRHHGAAAGAVITASHNPVEDNGLKLFDSRGHKYSDDQEIAVERLTLTGETTVPRPHGIAVGRVRQPIDALQPYADHLLWDVPNLEGLPIMVDCANGAAAFIAPEVYRRAGAAVTIVAGKLDGDNINAGVGATSLEHLRRCLTDQRGQLGLAHDGDADRLVGVDEQSQPFDGADLLAMFGVQMSRSGALKGSTLVTTPVTNSGLAPSMRRHGVTVVESGIGDRAVLRTMLERGFTLGGEQYGHIIMLDRATTGDGILSALHLLSLLVRSGSDVATMRTVWERTPQSLVNVAVTDRSLLTRDEKVRSATAEETARLGGKGRLLVRMSTIEPIARVMCEAPTQQEADDIAQRIAAVIRQRNTEGGKHESG